MDHFRHKNIWLTLSLISPFIFFTANYALKDATSIYKTDFGNGLVIYADEYVNSGQWVFDCRYSRLINRQPLPLPLAELRQANMFTIGSMYELNAADTQLAKAAIRAITAQPDWYESLRYLYSGLGDNSNLDTHVFDLLAQHEGRTWALRVRQHIHYDGKSSFNIVALSYDPETYVDYAKALEVARKSCPVPQ